jgi:PhzF family phenazine biosynthesis protein
LTDNAVYVTAPEPAYNDILFTASQISAVLGIDPDSLDALYPVLLINAGLNTLIVPVADLETEVSMFPDEPALKAFCVNHGIDIVLTWCFSVQDDRHFAHSRVFAAKFGYLEDPATGSGNCAFGYYLLQNKLWNGDSIAIEQGGSNRIYNTVRLTCQNGRVLFGGGATTRIRGEYLLEGSR